jgi:hypothetical protein
VTPGANLPHGVVDTYGQFVVGVHCKTMQISGKIVIRHLLLQTAVNLLMVPSTLVFKAPPMLLTPEVHLELRLSFVHFDQTGNDGIEIIRALEKMIQ